MIEKLLREKKTEHGLLTAFLVHISFSFPFGAYQVPRIVRGIHISKTSAIPLSSTSFSRSLSPQYRALRISHLERAVTARFSVLSSLYPPEQLPLDHCYPAVISIPLRYLLRGHRLRLFIYQIIS